MGSTALSPGWAPPPSRPLPVPGWFAPPGRPLPVPGWFAPPGRPLPVPGWAAPPAGRYRSPVGLYRSVPRMGRTARWSPPLPGWAIPLGPPDGPHRPLVAAAPRLGYTARSPGWAAPPAGRCRSPVGLYHSVPRVGAPPGWPLPVPDGPHRPLVAAGPRLGYTARSPGWAAPPAGRYRSSVGLYRSVPRMGRTARWSLPLPGWAIPLGPPDGPHRPLVAAGPRLGYTTRSPRWAAPPAGRCRSPVGLYRSVPRVGCTARWSLPVLSWVIPLGPPDGPHRPLVAAAPRLGYTSRSPGWAAPPAGRYRSSVGLYRSVPRMGRTARWSLPLPGWAIPLGPPGGRTARLAATGP